MGENKNTVTAHTSKAQRRADENGQRWGEIIFFHLEGFRVHSKNGKEDGS